jgi:hypothetical protein
MLWLARLASPIAAEEIDRLLRDHDGGGIRITRDEARHDARIDDEQSLRIPS